MSIFIKRKDDKNVLKYWLPFGYMRRHLARVYGFRVVNGDFVKVRIEPRDVSGFHLIDMIPLGFVMAWQRRHPVASSSAGGVVLSREERQIQALTKDLRQLRAEFLCYRKQADAEIERLSVECMRLQLRIGNV